MCVFVCACRASVTNTPNGRGLVWNKLGSLNGKQGPVVHQQVALNTQDSIINKGVVHI